MLPLLKLLILTLLLSYLIPGILLYLNQANYLYYPTPQSSGHSVPELHFTLDDATIRVFQINPGQPRALLYFGGNAEAVIDNAAPFGHYFPGQTIYLVNYRGYGGSSGAPSEAALYQDALAVFDRIAEQHHSITVMGRSLGSGIATYLATRRKVDKLVLITPCDSMQQLAKQHYPLYPVAFLLREKYDSVGRAGEIAVATLMLIAGNDRIIPPVRSKNLAAAFRDGVLTARVIEGAGHNNISHYPEYYQALQNFLESDPQ